jgi:putative transposase
MRIEIIEGHVCKDHIHMCLSITPKYAFSEVIGILKGKTEIRMFKRFPELRKSIGEVIFGVEDIMPIL